MVELQVISKEYDLALANIIKEVLTEYGAAQSGTVFEDETLNKLSTTFNGITGQYFLAFVNGELVGGAGINPLEGEQGYCELQRMFLHSKARGKGVGSLLMKASLNFAIEAGYQYCYLETMPKMQEAVALYRHYGFAEISHHMGNTGHFSCTTTMLLKLEESMHFKLKSINYENAQLESIGRPPK